MTPRTNGERLAVIETEIKGLKADVGEVKLLIKEHTECVDARISDLRNDFAAKWVEKISIAVVGSVVTAIIVGVVYLL